MVKYADRGLTENGSVSQLFQTLYLLVCVSLFSVFAVFAFFYKLNRDPDKKSNFHLMCMGETLDFSNFESMKSIALIIALSLPLFLSLISMFLSIKYYLHSRGISKKVPVIFGKFRRNIFSLTEIFVFTVIFFVPIYCQYFMILFHNLLGISPSMLRIHLLIVILVRNVILEALILPISILWNLQRKMPEFFSNQKVSLQKFNIICDKNMEPRRICDSSEAKAMFSKKFTKKYKSDYILKNHSVHDKRISKMPEIV